MKAYFSLILFLIAHSLLSQSFSEDKDKFREQAINRLRSLRTEPAQKIALDFQNAWDEKFTWDQQELVHTIALKMQKRQLRFYPYYYHFFSYLAYSVAQENLDRAGLNDVLKINDQVIGYLKNQEYADFLSGLNLFFIERYLSYDNNLCVQVSDESYSFELLDQVVEESPLAKFTFKEDTAKPDTGYFNDQDTKQYHAEPSEDGDWGSDDDWGSDEWGSDDSWDSSGDDWGYDNSTDEAESLDQPTAQAPRPKKPSFSPQIMDYLKSTQNKYLHPSKEGPVINLTNNRILIATPYDSFKIKSINGAYLLKDRTLLAESGLVEWSGQNENFKGATIQLNQFHIKKNRSDFWTPNATLKYPKASAESIPGVFEFRSTARNQNAISKYPIFTSNKADLTVNLTNQVTYTGGIQLRGNEFYGEAVSKEDGTLKILDGRGNSVMIHAGSFRFEDSVASTNNGRIAIIHGSDSIFHKSVRAKYDFKTKELRVLRNSNIAPYHFTFFDITVGIDLIKWNLETDSISMEIMNAKDLLPATFESNKYFDPIKFAKLGRYLPFNPITVLVNYSRKYDIKEIYAGELALEYDIHESYAKAAGKMLFEYGLADYNSQTGLIKLYERVFHYYDASSKSVDYDNLFIPSKIKDGYNAIFSIDSSMLTIRGVSKFYLTADYNVFVEPRDSTIQLLPNKGIKFDGKVSAGDFESNGANFEFDYNEFLINMPQIDSIKFYSDFLDSTSTDSSYVSKKTDNQLTLTKGILYLDLPTNKAGRETNNQYPIFSTLSDAVVYFDGKEILDGAYDKSIRFIIPPFTLDSVQNKDREKISFEGTFNSGGIFPTFRETLLIQDDGSFGFTHQIPEEGYHLYDTDATTYEKISLSNKGIRGYGKIDFLTTTVYSDDFIYYPNLVTASCSNGVISPGDMNGVSYPEAVLERYDMYWLPRKDSMHLKTVDEPFELYNSTAKFTGGINITTTGVYGGGTIYTRGSQAISKNMSFKEFSYTARHAEFDVLTDDPKKPAMYGEDIRVDFDLNTNTALVYPEQSGVAAISFPYAQMKTSITEAVWDLEDSVVNMTKPKEIPIEDSYFFTTRSDLDSLAFNAEEATYDINTQELNVKGIPYIIVADAKIIPKNNETVILANSELRQFEDSEIIMDTLNEYHHLDKASISVISRNKFEGNAWYQQIVYEDTFDIRFDSFEFQEIPVRDGKKKKKTRLMTVSGGEVYEEQNFVVSAGFQYKGNVIMYSAIEALELEGAVKLILEKRHCDWILYSRNEDEDRLEINLAETTFEGGEKILAGIHTDIEGELYHTIAQKKNRALDSDFFLSEGLLTYHDDRTYKIESPNKASGDSYQGKTYIYNDSTQSVFFEGTVDFIDPDNSKFGIRASVNGTGTLEGDYEVDAMMIFVEEKSRTSTLDFLLNQPMIYDLIEVIERTGLPPANTTELKDLAKIANLVGDESAKLYEDQSAIEYTALIDVSKALDQPLVISGVTMKWSKEEKAWYNTTKLGISNMRRADINAKMDGFLEIKKDDSGDDLINVFIQAAPGSWYFISYSKNQIIAYSSNPNYNDLIKSKSNIDKAKPGQLVLVIGDENETLSFINEFRKKYYDINEPYNLVFPDEFSTEEDEGFDSIEEDDDDGFGF